MNYRINKLVATIPVGINPIGLTDTDHNYQIIYVTNQGSNTVSVINATSNKVVATIPVGIHPINIGKVEELPQLQSVAEIISSANFILPVFERLSQNEYGEFIKSLTPSEQNDLINNPTADNLDSFLK